jgi:hypothetical protein
MPLVKDDAGNISDFQKASFYINDEFENDNSPVNAKPIVINGVTQLRSATTNKEREDCRPPFLSGLHLIPHHHHTHLSIHYAENYLLIITTASGVPIFFNSYNKRKSRQINGGENGH